MNKWTREQRNRLLMLIAGTISVIVLVWFTLISTLRHQLAGNVDKIAVARHQVELTKTGINLEGRFKSEIQTNQQKLRVLENQMSHGDLYRWIIGFARDIESKNDVNIASFEPPRLGESTIPPKVPYKSVTYSMTGLAYYSDFGSFLADLENSSPFIRIRSLTLQSTAAGLALPAASEKLAFSVEFSTLVKSDPSQP